MKLYELKSEAMNFDRATEISPLYYEGYNTAREEAEMKDIKGWKGILNIDKRKMSAIVSNRYNIVQHREVIEAVADAVMNLNISADARVRDNGDSIFVDLTFQQQKIKLREGEEFFVGLRLINSYNKTTGIVVAPRLLRCVCNNGMVVNKIVPGYSVKHTKKLRENFEGIVEKLLKKMINSIDSFKTLVNDCIGDSIEWEMLDKILKDMSGAEKHYKAIKRLLPTNPTRWDLYNAFTDYATHGEQIRPNVEQKLQVTSQQILTTPLRQLLPKEKPVEATQ